MPRRPSPALLVAALLTVTALGPLAACSKSSGSTADFCADLKKTPTLESVLTGYADIDPAELADRLDAAKEGFDQLRDSAPSEIDGDVDEMVSLVDDVLAAVKRHKDDPEAVAGDLRQAVRGRLGAAKASLRVAAYGATKCDVKLNPAEIPPETTSTTGG